MGYKDIPAFPRDPKLRAPRSHRAAFTLVEVMLASFVLVVGILSALATLQGTFRMLDNSRNAGLAAQIMQSEIERLRLLTWDNLVAEGNGTVDVATVFSADPALARRFIVTRTISDVSSRSGTMKEISVSVTWHGVDQAAHTRTFKTRYSKDGLYSFYHTAARS